MAYDEEFIRANPHVSGGGIRRTQSPVSRVATDAVAGPGSFPPGFGPGGPMMGPHGGGGGYYGGGGGYSWPGMLMALGSTMGGSSRAAGTKRGPGNMWGMPGSVPVDAGDRGIAQEMANYQRNPWEEEEEWQKGLYGGMSQGGSGGRA